MSKFLESAAARETSPELMEAIHFVAGRDDARAEAIWEDGGTCGEFGSIVEVVTKYGLHDTTEFFWGAARELWATAEAVGSYGYSVVYVAGNSKCPADVIYDGLTFDDAEARCDALNRETRGALGRYAVRHA